MPDCMRCIWPNTEHRRWPCMAPCWRVSMATATFGRGVWSACATWCWISNTSTPPPAVWTSMRKAFTRTVPARSTRSAWSRMVACWSAAARPSSTLLPDSEVVMSQVHSSRRALVTGGSGDLGGAISRALAAGGYHVVVHANTSLARADDVASAIRDAGGGAQAVAFDVTDAAATRHAIETLLVDGPIHAVVNN